MSKIARTYLNVKTSGGVNPFNIKSPKKEGGIVGSLVGLGYLTRDEAEYTITGKGRDYIAPIAPKRESRKPEARMEGLKPRL